MCSQLVINLDRNASWGVRPEVWEKLRALDFGSNPSSIHQDGQRARAIVESARDSLRALLQLPSDVRVIFTSGATEANNQIIFGLEVLPEAKVAQFVSTTIEHPSILEPLHRQRALGFGVVLVSPIKGAILPETIAHQVTAQTKLVSVMFANNETGHIQAVSEIAAAVRLRHPRVVLHSDAVQALGRVAVDWRALGIDALTISGHKLGGFSGSGALIVDRRVALNPILYGGAQEQQYRPGTENVLGIASLGFAADLARAEQQSRPLRMSHCRARLRGMISAAVPAARWNDRADGLPNTLSLTIPGQRGDDLVVALDLAGVRVSSGAACSSGKPNPSHVLLELGLSESDARSTIRISLSGDETEADLEHCAAALGRVLVGAR